jgi:RimJ/RimL family protein N-acetyltransferase
MAYGWEGEKVRLAPLDRERHLENAVRWMNDPDVTAWTLGGDVPITRVAEEGFFTRQSTDVLAGTQTEITFAVETLEGEHIGFSDLHRIDWRQGVAGTGTLLGRRDLWGKGFGADAARIRTRYAFDVLGLRLLLSEALADNAGSIGMLTRAGYREVGRIPRRYWKRGAYRDSVLFALERPG